MAKVKINEDLGKINEETKDYPYQFLERHNDNYFSLSLIENILKTILKIFNLSKMHFQVWMKTLKILAMAKWLATI